MGKSASEYAVQAGAATATHDPNGAPEVRLDRPKRGRPQQFTAEEAKQRARDRVREFRRKAREMTQEHWEEATQEERGHGG